MAEITLPKINMPEVKAPAAPGGTTLIEIEQLSLFYGASKALKNISLNLGEKVVTAFIGPSG